ncbi:MAG: hypothetical protein KC466_18780 [Myxococcales bacterium]|nr:hypothetical protein [Myxococcales bacterium]
MRSFGNISGAAPLALLLAVLTGPPLARAAEPARVAQMDGEELDFGDEGIVDVTGGASAPSENGDEDEVLDFGDAGFKDVTGTESGDGSGTAGDEEELDFGDEFASRDAATTPPSAFERWVDDMRAGFEPKLASYRGFLITELAVDTHKDNDEENLLYSRNRVFFETTLSFTSRIKTVVSARGEYGVARGGEPNTDAEFDLYEAYADFDLGDVGPGRLYVRVGKQINAWGGAAFFSPNDLLNPYDADGFIDLDPQDLRIPIFMARVDYNISPFNVQFVYIPFFEPMRFDRFGTDFSIIQPGTPPATLFGDLFGDLDPETRNLLQPLYFTLDRPKNNFSTGEIGMRFSGSVGSLDFGLSFLHTRRDFPALETTFLPFDDAILGGAIPTGLRGSFPRQNEWGLDLAYATSGWTFKAEANLTDKSRVNVERRITLTALPGILNIPLLDITTVGSRSQPGINLLVGAEYLIDSNTQSIVSFELLDRMIRGRTRDLIAQHEHTVTSTFIYRGSYWEERIQPELRWIQVWNDGSFFLTPKLSYVHNGWLTVGVGANIIEGKRPSFDFLFPSGGDLLGIFDNLDQVFVQVKVNF